MTAIDFIRLSLEMSKGWILGLAADMKDAPLQRPCSGGNHPLWCLGHLAYSEANLVSVLCKGEDNPLSDWAGVFGIGSSPGDDESAYPSCDDVMAKVEQTRGVTMAYLDSITDEDLGKPSHAEGEMKEWFGTVGQCLAAISTHVGFHGGQIADARRAAGRGILMG